jgi:hypothetical protein
MHEAFGERERRMGGTVPPIVSDNPASGEEEEEKKKKKKKPCNPRERNQSLGPKPSCM